MTTQASAVAQIGPPASWRGAPAPCFIAASGPRTLITRSLAEVRLTQAFRTESNFLVAGFIAELASALTLDANARAVRLTVTPVEDGVPSEADRQVVACGLPSGVISHSNVGEVGPGFVATHRSPVVSERLSCAILHLSRLDC